MQVCFRMVGVFVCAALTLVMGAVQVDRVVDPSYVHAPPEIDTQVLGHLG